MKVSLLTDAPKHNYALMRISAFHKAQGDEVMLNEPLSCDYDISYGSWLYHQDYYTDFAGGTIKPLIKERLDDKFPIKPDYTLYPDNDFSIGYTWEYCPRKCKFCVVPKQRNKKGHRSIWDFHNPQFSKICLLNNNTFSDPNWLDTFQEIWDAKLVVIDENGYDLRLLDEEKALALRNTKFEKQIHFAWDLMEDETEVVRGLKIAQDYKLNAMAYVLIGYNTSRDEDIYRCQVIHHFGFDPYPMPYNGGSRADKAFKRFVCLRYYRKGYRSMKEAWENYR